MSRHTASRARGPRGSASAPGLAASLATALCTEKPRHSRIAEAAYFRSLHRGFAPGHELEDWLAAEAEVDASLDIGVPER
jgi:hypothetical protein